jgi:chloramphenicol-sensitive protein RarD
MKRGIWYAAAAYVIWGLLPVYWKWLHSVPAGQIISHRLIWSAALLAVLIVSSRQVTAFRANIANRRVLLIYGAAAVLVTGNWLTYIWAVNAGYIVETSLGYFINPLISILFGVVFLRERLRPWQWVAIAISAAGVAYLTVTYGHLPWIALTLAVTFALYGLVKKLAPLSSSHGLALETGMMSLPALVYLVFVEKAGTGAFVHAGATTSLLLVGAGFATTIPLLLFASAARRVPLTWLGVLQYLAPTLQFLLGVFVYGETVSMHRMLGFGLVWLALIVFGVEGFVAHRPATFPATAE